MKSSSPLSRPIQLVYEKASRSFRTKIFLLAVLSAIVPLALLGGTNLMFVRHLVYHNYRETLDITVGATARGLGTWLEEQKSTAAALARTADLRQFFANRQLHKPGSDEAFLDLVRLYKVIQLCNESSIWITEVRVADTDGRVVLSDNLSAINGLAVPSEGQMDLEAVVKQKEVRTSKIYLAVTPAPIHATADELGTGFPTMWIYAPIVGEGDVLGILSLRLAIQDLNQRLTREAGDLPLDMFLVDTQGRNKTAGRVDVLSQPKEGRGSWTLLQPIPETQDNSPWPQAGGNMAGFPSYRDKTVVGAWFPVPGWEDVVVMAEVDREAITKPLWEQVRSNLITGCSLALVCGLSAFLVAGRLLSPLRKLAEASARLAAGDRSVRVNLKGSDEIGQLARTFDNTAAAIEATLKELEVARDEALEASRAKGRFLANMTHELRTPLNAIIGYSEMLIVEAQDAGPPMDGFVPDLQTILTAGRHLLELINGILDLSKIEAGKMTVYLEDFELQEVVNEVRQTILPLVAENKNLLEVRIGPGIGVVKLDRTKLKQILFNLLSNACKFTKEGRLELFAELQDGFLFIGVSDTGIGMTPTQLSRIFEEFAQADESTTRKYGGTGLGLTIVKRFVDLMGGEISVDSEPGKGTTFRLRFPAHRVGLSTVEPAAPSLETGGPVLVIDDDPAIRDMLARLLGKEGYQVLTAGSGPEALELMKAHRPAAVTLDVMMPEMSGWTVLSQIKNDPGLADVPVLMLTVTEDPSLGYALGAAEYLTKPVDTTRLLKTLERYQQPDGPILVVDDDAAARRWVGQALEGIGRQVLEAENGRVALQKIAEQRPGIILLDLNMPEMDGFEFLRELRKDPQTRSVPVLVLTATELSPEEHLQLTQSTQLVLTKGEVKWGDLRQTLDRMLRRS